MARPRAKVLVVDDDPATRDGLTALLETWGYSAELGGGWQNRS